MTTENESFYEGFPNLQAIDMELDNQVGRIRNEMSEVKTNERYDSNESERDYQLKQLEEEMEATLSAHEDKFQTELQATEAYLVEMAFRPTKADEFTMLDAKQTVEDISTQVLATVTPTDILPLLAQRVKTLNDVEKGLLLRELPEIRRHAESNGRFEEEKKEIREYLDDIQAEVGNTAHGRELKEQQELLQRIKSGGGSIRRKHDAIANVTRNMRTLI